MEKLQHFTRGVWQSLKQAFTAWGDIEPFNKSIIIAYYTIFSLPGLLVIIVNIAGYFFGRDAVTGEITGQIQGMK